MVSKSCLSIKTKTATIRKGRSFFDFRSENGLSETGQYSLKTCVNYSYDGKSIIGQLLLIYKTNWSFWSNNDFDPSFCKDENIVTYIPFDKEDDLSAWDFFVRYKQEWLFVCLKKEVMFFDIAKGVWYRNSQFRLNNTKPWDNISISACGNVIAAIVQNEESNKFFLEFFDFSNPIYGWRMISNPNVCPVSMNFKFRWTAVNTIICNRYLIGLKKTENDSQSFQICVQTIELKIVPRCIPGFKISLIKTYNEPKDSSETCKYRTLKGLEQYFPHLF